MRISVFSTIIEYFRNVLRGVHSILRSSFTTVPYLFSFGDKVKEVTEQYPDPVSSRGEDDLPPRTRGLLYNDINKCTGCLECQNACPVQCINIEIEPQNDGGKKWVSIFNVDFGRCMFCGICAEVCEPCSLVHTKQFEGAVYELSDLVTAFGRGKISEEQRERLRQLRKQGEVEI